MTSAAFRSRPTSAPGRCPCCHTSRPLVLIRDGQLVCAWCYIPWKEHC